MLRYAEIKYCDIANGPGVRVSLFVQGCSHHCKGCFNESTWDPNGGKEFTDDVKFDMYKELSKDYVEGITILGGEPTEQAEEVAELLKEIKSLFPNKNIWLYTGSYFQDVYKLEMFDYVDVVVDGPFIEDQKDISLQFRGSKNQNIIDVKENYLYKNKDKESMDGIKYE